MLQFMGSQRVGHDWVTELNWGGYHTHVRYQADTQAVQKWATSCDHRESGIVMQMFIFPYKWWLEARYKVKYLKCICLMVFPGGSNGQKICLQCRRPGFDPWVWKIPLKRVLPMPVFLPGEFHGQRTLVGYSPWGRKETDMTERLIHIHTVWCNKWS